MIGLGKSRLQKILENIWALNIEVKFSTSKGRTIRHPELKPSRQLISEPIILQAGTKTIHEEYVKVLNSIITRDTWHSSSNVISHHMDNPQKKKDMFDSLSIFFGLVMSIYIHVERPLTHPILKPWERERWWEEEKTVIHHPVRRFANL